MPGLTTTLTRGNGLWSLDSSNYVGHWTQQYWNYKEYGAVVLDYVVPMIDDRMESRTVAVQIAADVVSGSARLYAVLSTKEPVSGSTDWRFGPSENDQQYVISNEASWSFTWNGNGGTTSTIEFTVNDLVWLSGRSVYLYLYDHSLGYGTSYNINAVRCQGSQNGTLYYDAAYKLTVSAGTGSTVTVRRQKSDFLETGTIGNNSSVYSTEELLITAAPDSNYRITSLLVNNASFPSGNTHVVSGNVNVVSTAQVLSSSVGATDANIESVSAITVTKYDNAYVHSIQYSFGGLSGYITASGGTSSSEVKFGNTSISFTVPSSFYAQIPNAQYGTCTITCKTYSSASSTEQLGSSTTCTFVATASPERCAPTVSGTVIDTNSVSIALTGDSSKIVRYVSSAECTVDAAARNGATIASKSINGTAPDANNKLVITGDSLASGAFVFSATDSRGYTATTNVTADFIPYVKLTCNPVFTRTTPTGGGVSLTFNGKAFPGAWRSGVNNRLTIKYRYKKSGDTSYSRWVTLSSGYTLQSSGYSTTAPIQLEDTNGNTDTFDYRYSYAFQINVSDGDGTNTCQTVTRDATIQKGTPVFDWGENDFRFNVPIKIGSTTLTEAQLQSLLALISN